MKQKFLLENKRAFTLLELIVTLAISLILVLSLSSILDLGFNSINFISSSKNNPQTATLILKDISDELMYADRVFPSSDFSQYSNYENSLGFVIETDFKQDDLSSSDGNKVEFKRYVYYSLSSDNYLMKIARNTMKRANVSRVFVEGRQKPNPIGRGIRSVENSYFDYQNGFAYISLQMLGESDPYTTAVFVGGQE